MNKRFLCFTLQTSLSPQWNRRESIRCYKLLPLESLFKESCKKNCENYLLYFLHDLSVFIQSKKIISVSNTACSGGSKVRCGLHIIHINHRKTPAQWGMSTITTVGMRVCCSNSFHNDVLNDKMKHLDAFSNFISKYWKSSFHNTNMNAHFKILIIRPSFFGSFWQPWNLWFLLVQCA